MSKQTSFDLDDQKFLLTASQIRAILEEQAKLTLLDCIDHLGLVEPHRTLTARKLINPAILQIEKKHATQH